MINKLNILHTTPSMGVNSGGPTLSIYLTVKGLQKNGLDADIITYQVTDKSDELIAEENFIQVLPPVSNFFAYSKGIKDFLQRNLQYDIYHIQGVWLYPSLITARIARRFKKPYIITPRGMLYPQDLAKGKLKKSMFLKLFLMNDLQKATCLHATCVDEMNHLRKLGIKSPIAIIPNPIEIREYPEKKEDTVFRLGYLGRLHPRKNVESLLHAFAELGNKAEEAELLIIGGGNEKYEQFLKAKVIRLGLQNVKFTGFLSGAEKDKALASLSVLAMPSEFENMGNVILEGLTRRIPCIATKGSPWQELELYG